MAHFRLFDLPNELIVNIVEVGGISGHFLRQTCRKIYNLARPVQRMKLQSPHDPEVYKDALRWNEAYLGLHEWSWRLHGDPFTSDDTLLCYGCRRLVERRNFFDADTWYFGKKPVCMRCTVAYFNDQEDIRAQSDIHLHGVRAGSLLQAEGSSCMILSIELHSQLNSSAVVRKLFHVAKSNT